MQELQGHVSTKEARIPLRYSAEHLRFFFFFLRRFCSSGIEQQFPECVPWGFNRCYEVRELRRASQDWEAQSQIGRSGFFTAGLSELHLHHVGGTLQVGAGQMETQVGYEAFPSPLATGSSSSQSCAWGRHFENGWNWSRREPPTPAEVKRGQQRREKSGERRVLGERTA